MNYDNEDDKYDAIQEGKWEIAQERRKERAMRIWNDTYGLNQSDYYRDFLEQHGIYKQFNEWLVYTLNDEYPEEDDE